MIGLEFTCKIFKKEQKELAEKLKIAPPNISSWLKGTREIPTKYLADLSKIFNGLPTEYFQKELTYTDELKIRIYYIEKVLQWEERHEPFHVYDGDNNNELLYDLTEDDYADELSHLYKELNNTIKINSYQDRMNTLFEQIRALETIQKVELFQDKDPEDFIMNKLNSYLDFLSKFQVKDISTVDLIVNYMVNYQGIEQGKWGEQEVFPNEKLLAFYKDLEETLIKHNVI